MFKTWFDGIIAFLVICISFYACTIPRAFMFPFVVVVNMWLIHKIYKKKKTDVHLQRLEQTTALLYMHSTD